MDYEKAYKAVLKTATQWIKDGCTDKEKICLECVFPELRESEDERIRKWLVDYFGSIKETVWIHRDITCEHILGWLEKQKEQKPAEGKEYSSPECGTTAGVWSEEDEKIIRSIRHILFEHAFENGGVDVNGDYCEDVYIQANDFLLSLRPSWKPSEEHLSALLAVFNDPNNIGSQTCQLALTDLYEQLKKL